MAVSGGRHSASGSSSTEGGLQIDLELLKKVRVDKEKKLIYAQGGATWKDVDTAAGESGLAAVGGVVSTTGVGGLSSSPMTYSRSVGAPMKDATFCEIPLFSR